MKKIVIGILGVAMVAVIGCSKEAETPSPNRAVGVGSGSPGTPASSGGASEEEVWKFEWGPEEAPVKVEAFYPLNEGHAWVKEYAQEISEKYPTQVQVIAYDFTSDRGGEEWSKRGLTCGTWQINGEIGQSAEGTEFLRSGTIGGWTKEDLIAAVDRAVQAGGGEEAAEGTAGSEGQTADPEEAGGGT